MIYTHINVDLDAVCSVWFAQEVMGRDDGVTFVPAGWDGKGASDCDLILDLDAGGRGLKGERDGCLVHSCFRSLVSKYADDRQKEALRRLATFVDVHDTHGQAVKRLAPEASPESQEVIGEHHRYRTESVPGGRQD